MQTRGLVAVRALVPAGVRRRVRRLRDALGTRRERPVPPGAAASTTADAVAPAAAPSATREDRSWLYVHQCPEEQKVSQLEKRHPRTRILILATGPSAQLALPWDPRLHERYDVVIALNGSVKHFRDIDYFLSVESHAHKWDWYYHPVPPGTIRCVSESGRRLAAESGRPDPQPAYLLLRHLYDAPPDIRHYRNAAGEEGLIVGPRGETRLGRGTVSCQAIHLAAMLGASEIHLIGADLHFRGPVQHFYGDNEYGTHEVDGKRYHALDVERKLNPIVTARHPRTGEIVETTLHFRESAEFIDDLVRGALARERIAFVDFSDGLISAGLPADFGHYMETGELVSTRDVLAGSA